MSTFIAKVTHIRHESHAYTRELLTLLRIWVKPHHQTEHSMGVLESQLPLWRSCAFVTVASTFIFESRIPRFVSKSVHIHHGLVTVRFKPELGNFGHSYGLERTATAHFTQEYALALRNSSTFTTTGDVPSLARTRELLTLFKIRVKAHHLPEPSVGTLECPLAYSPWKSFIYLGTSNTLTD